VKKFIFVPIMILLMLSLPSCNRATIIPSMEIISITVGDNTSYAIDCNDGLWAWGAKHKRTAKGWHNRRSRQPRKIMEDVIAIDSNNLATVAIRADGSLWSWREQYLA